MLVEQADPRFLEPLALVAVGGSFDIATRSIR